MARNDGVDRTSVRNLAVSDKAVGNTQQHNEREKDSYRNPDIIPQRTSWNVHFKKPTASYTDLFAQLEADGTISTRGLKPDATHYCELVFDVNSAYFDNHGGYEFAKQFYEDAYKAAVQIVGGEQYILSAVMHADEINHAMTEALGREVYHYHLHVVYVPVVEKQILWSKRCKDKALVGTVKETVMQVSRSKKWASKPLLDDAGKPVLQKNGKPVLKKSYSVLQDDFFNYMRNAGYTEDSLLAAMETAGAGDMPEDTERKGLGTPATRAATLEKLVSAGFVDRKKKQLIPTEKGANLILVLPDNIKSPTLTAEWESMLKQVERGELAAESFMEQIADMSRTLVKEHTAPEKRFSGLFPDAKRNGGEAVGACPRCGGTVYEDKKGFFCDNRDCAFALWKDNKFFSGKKKSITKSVAAALLKEGRVSMSGLYSEKTGKTYDAVVLLDDTGGKYVNFKLEFPAKKGRKK